MKINNITALDYRAQGDSLELVLTGASLEDITGMDATLVTVRTDEGDIVEAFAGFSLASVTYEVESGTFQALLLRQVESTTGRALEALTARVAAQESAQEDTMLALAELAGLIAAGQEATPSAGKEV